ncbi:hypothetical protein AAG612_09130 [Citromicrobium bathyomarinum]|uniref:hypothetical protein n=1 Tax=Citromicrobium bathyomarinum TaxID=72174 RepID=UPI00315AC186
MKTGCNPSIRTRALSNDKNRHAGARDTAIAGSLARVSHSRGERLKARLPYCTLSLSPGGKQETGIFMSLKGYNGPVNLPDRYVVSSTRPIHANDNAQAAHPRARQSNQAVPRKSVAPSCEIVELV